MRPEDLGAPQYHVDVLSKGGQHITITDRVTQLVHTDEGGRSTSKVDITLDNGDDFIAAQPEVMRKGAKFVVSYGYPNYMRRIGEWYGKEHKGDQDNITVSAHPVKKSKLVRRLENRTWVNTTRSAVVREVLAYHGFPRQQVSVDDSTIVLPFITQARENDWVFLQGLADKEGRKLWFDEDGVHWQRYQNGKDPTHMFRYVRGMIGIGLIKSFSIDSFGAGIPGRIKLSGRDPVTKKAFVAYASDTETSGLVKMADTDDIVSVEQGDKVAAGATGHELIRNVGSRSYDEAKRLADALYKDYRYNALKVNIETIGDPTLRTNNTILLWGLGPLLDGKYLVKSSTHTLGDGYSGSTKLARDGFNKSKKSLNQQEFDTMVDRLIGLPWLWRNKAAVVSGEQVPQSRGGSL